MFLNIRLIQQICTTFYCFVVLLLLTTGLHAQCTSSIASFPYQEDFEASSGTWVPGGTASDWSWGTPLKPVINKAASGAKCWITGTLTQRSYSLNENSTLTSPCFNFTAVKSPFIRFKVFWETEKKYDGASFQYSDDGGATWKTLGSYSDYTSCPANNWFNTSGITVLGTHGWSGNIQPTAACTGGAGNGSGDWVLAQHEMAALAGKTNVKFRFTFGAGSQCNNYDGFAIDDIWIGEAPGTTAEFTYFCSGPYQVNFNATVPGCSGTPSWNFGDPSSGTSNISSQLSVSHTYSTPGTYTISFSIPGLSAPVTKQVTIASISLAVIEDIRCNGDKNASVLAQVSPSGVNYQYSWGTTPQQSTAMATGLGAGSYSMKVLGQGICTNYADITLTEPAKLTRERSLKDPMCDQPNGDASVQVRGGSQPYTFHWLPNGESTPSIKNLLPGRYSVMVSDDNGCTDTANFVLVNQNPLSVWLGNDTAFCPGEQLVLSPGSYAYYTWQDNSISPTYTVTQTGDYFVQVTDANGCSARDSIRIAVDCSDIWFPTAFTPNNDRKNDSFGPLGNLATVKDYSMRVYGRWGQEVFRSTTPYQHWNGKTGSNELHTQTFVWIAAYTQLGRKEKVIRKGVVTLIR